MKTIERFSHISGMMIKKTKGGWIKYSDVKGEIYEIKEWMRKHATHANYPDCKIRDTKKCTCGLNNFIQNSI